MATLTKRIEALEAAAPEVEPVRIIRLVPLRADGDDTAPTPAREAEVNGQRLVRAGGESEEAFFARVRAQQRPGEIMVVYCADA